MVIVRISHGLGNQMFQYACGRALALTNQTEIKLDLAHYCAHQDRAYGLDRFRVSASPATESEVAAISGCAPGERRRGFRKHLHNALGCLRPWDRRRVLREGAKVFDPALLRVRGELYLMGYWQSPRYFDHLAETIRSDFTLRDEPTDEFCRAAEEIARHPSVAVHVRRGDYVGIPALEMADPKRYYAAALERIAARVPGVRACIFSDDPVWAAANLHLPVPARVVSGTCRCAPHEEMLLMARCDHQVIANSTFSWWGAWLNRNPNKIVTAPRTWFHQAGLANADILPAGWLEL